MPEKSTEEKKLSKKGKKTLKILKFTFYITLSIFWFVAAFLAIRDVWNTGEFFKTKWPLISLIATAILIIAVLIPLFKELKSDITKIKKEKTKGHDKT